MGTQRAGIASPAGGAPARVQHGLVTNRRHAAGVALRELRAAEGTAIAEIAESRAVNFVLYNPPRTVVLALEAARALKMRRRDQSPLVGRLLHPVAPPVLVQLGGEGDPAAAQLRRPGAHPHRTCLVDPVGVGPHFGVHYPRDLAPHRLNLHHQAARDLKHP